MSWKHLKYFSRANWHDVDLARGGRWRERGDGSSPLGSSPPPSSFRLPHLLPPSVFRLSSSVLVQVSSERGSAAVWPVLQAGSRAQLSLDPVSVGGSAGKESVCNAGGAGSAPRSGRSPGGGNGHPLQCSCLGHPTTEEAGGLQAAEAETRSKRLRMQACRVCRVGLLQPRLR